MQRALFVLILSFAIPAFATRAVSTDGVIGMLEIPSLFGTLTPDGPPGQKPAVKVRALHLRSEPSPTAKAPITVGSPDSLLSREHDYEAKSAMVYDRKGDWFLVKTEKGQGWVPQAEAGKFHPVADLLEHGMSYLESHWDGKLYEGPGSAKFRKVKGPHDFSVLERREVSGQPWFKVQLIEGRCDTDINRDIGWIPVFDSQKRPNAWFYSRGC